MIKYKEAKTDEERYHTIDMTAQEFLKKTLKEWESLFEGIKLKYAYDVMTEYHIVEVEPEDILLENSDYKKTEFQLWMDFMENYPDEYLLICPPSDANDMTNVLFETRLV
jgi:hypothetical protein